MTNGIHTRLFQYDFDILQQSQPQQQVINIAQQEKQSIPQQNEFKERKLICHFKIVNQLIMKSSNYIL